MTANSAIAIEARRDTTQVDLASAKSLLVVWRGAYPDHPAKVICHRTVTADGSEALGGAGRDQPTRR
ncbi:MAG TPA: hypothetical protein VGS60_09165 [Actinomycetes bacterium]|nr:hypothetical protein [Actinomycetes bacterium]